MPSKRDWNGEGSPARHPRTSINAREAQPLAEFTDPRGAHQFTLLLILLQRKVRFIDSTSPTIWAPPIDAPTGPDSRGQGWVPPPLIGTPSTVCHPGEFKPKGAHIIQSRIQTSTLSIWGHAVGSVLCFNVGNDDEDFTKRGLQRQAPTPLRRSGGSPLLFR